MRHLFLALFAVLTMTGCVAVPVHTPVYQPRYVAPPVYYVTPPVYYYGPGIYYYGPGWGRGYGHRHR